MNQLVYKPLTFVGLIFAFIFSTFGFYNTICLSNLGLPTGRLNVSFLGLSCSSSNLSSSLLIGIKATGGGVTKCILKMKCGIMQGGLNPSNIKIIKEFQVKKGPLKVITPLQVRQIGIKYGPCLFSKNNIGVKNKDPRMYVQQNQFCMYTSQRMDQK